MREQVVPRLLEFWSFFRSKAAHAARQALSGEARVALQRTPAAASCSSELEFLHCMLGKTKL